ncbi:Oidioi.mRNA.OKI2018_I69.chr2.g4639.t1.cds [Oikopleura dioica]|uniref:Oidioi.mRNA.OKI2018_I69.chr2.g4639.t1.cds n=1 Tax=Oikopleura dioica TaxID=34765 RepID=A0ABN7T3J7_OIKDI|nr:Oidioi.mRNA.OKI2018_I69.chr2.g4639.t1.cds [Oikopleura dioica]
MYVGGVTNDISTTELGDYFEQIGHVTDVLIDYGMGIIKFDCGKSRDDAIQYLNRTSLKGSILNLEECLSVNVIKAMEYLSEPKTSPKQERSNRKTNTSRPQKRKASPPTTNKENQDKKAEKPMKKGKEETPFFLNIENLPDDATDSETLNFFVFAGDVVHFEIVMRRGRRTALLFFKTEQERQSAAHHLDKSFFKGYRLRVRE